MPIPTHMHFKTGCQRGSRAHVIIKIVDLQSTLALYEISWQLKIHLSKINYQLVVDVYIISICYWLGYYIICLSCLNMKLYSFFIEPMQFCALEKLSNTGISSSITVSNLNQKFLFLMRVNISLSLLNFMSVANFFSLNLIKSSSVIQLSFVPYRYAVVMSKNPFFGIITWILYNLIYYY